MDNFTLYMDLGKSSVSCQPYFHHRVDYYPRKQQIIYRHTAKKQQLPLLLAHLMLPDQKLSINQFIPGIWYSRKAPVAAVLISFRRSPLLISKVLLAVDGRVCILSVVSHSRYVQINNRSFHLVDHIFQNAHLWWVG